MVNATHAERVTGDTRRAAWRGACRGWRGWTGCRLIKHVQAVEDQSGSRVLWPTVLTKIAFILLPDIGRIGLSCIDNMVDTGFVVGHAGCPVGCPTCSCPNLSIRTVVLLWTRCSSCSFPSVASEDTMQAPSLTGGWVTCTASSSRAGRVTAIQDNSRQGV